MPFKNTSGNTIRGYILGIGDVEIRPGEIVDEHLASLFNARACLTIITSEEDKIEVRRSEETIVSLDKGLLSLEDLTKREIQQKLDDMQVEWNVRDNKTILIERLVQSEAKEVKEDAE